MNEALSTKIEHRIRKTSGRGEVLRNDLMTVTIRAGFSLAETVRHGVICADVEYGAEGYALLPYKPAFLILGEGPAYRGDEREAIIAGSLGSFHDTSVIIKREYALDLMEKLLEEGYENSVGLTTWLNIFPEATSKRSLYEFAVLSQKILHLSGHMIVSILEDLEDRHELVKAIVEEGIPGLRMLKLDFDLTSAGCIFLIGEKYEV